MFAVVGYWGFLYAFITILLLLCFISLVYYCCAVFPVHFKIIAQKFNLQKFDMFSIFQKYSLCFSFVSVIMLSISLWAIGEHERLSYGFFIFQKILVFGSIVVLCFDSFSVLWKFFLILAAILFNPFIQIPLEDEDVIMFFYVLAILLFIISWISLIRKSKSKNGSKETR